MTVNLNAAHGGNVHNNNQALVVKGHSFFTRGKQIVNIKKNIPQMPHAQMKEFKAGLNKMRAGVVLVVTGAVVLAGGIALGAALMPSYGAGIPVLLGGVLLGGGMMASGVALAVYGHGQMKDAEKMAVRQDQLTPPPLERQSHQPANGANVARAQPAQHTAPAGHIPSNSPMAQAFRNALPNAQGNSKMRHGDGQIGESSVSAEKMIDELFVDPELADLAKACYLDAHQHGQNLDMEFDELKVACYDRCLNGSNPAGNEAFADDDITGDGASPLKYFLDFLPAPSDPDLKARLRQAKAREENVPSIPPKQHPLYLRGQAEVRAGQQVVENNVAEIHSIEKQLANRELIVDRLGGPVANQIDLVFGDDSPMGRALFAHLIESNSPNLEREINYLNLLVGVMNGGGEVNGLKDWTLPNDLSSDLKLAWQLQYQRRSAEGWAAQG